MEHQGLLCVAGSPREHGQVVPHEENHFAEVDDQRPASSWRSAKVTLSLVVAVCAAVILVLALTPRGSERVTGPSSFDQTQRKWLDGWTDSESQEEESMKQFQHQDGRVNFHKVSTFLGAMGPNATQKDQPDVDTVMKMVVKKHPEVTKMGGLDSNQPLLGAQDPAQLAASLSFAKDRMDTGPHSLRAIR